MSFNPLQTEMFNRLMSESSSHLAAIEGNDICVFLAEGDLVESLQRLGFAQSIKRDKFGDCYGHTCYWQESEQLLVLNTPGYATWTIATEYGAMKGTDFNG